MEHVQEGSGKENLPVGARAAACGCSWCDCSHSRLPEGCTGASTSGYRPDLGGLALICSSTGILAAGEAPLAAGRLERDSTEEIFIGKCSFAEIKTFCGNT